MAAVMGLAQVRTLLGDAAKKGCSVAWVQGGNLTVGPHIGRPRYVIDFVRERLVDGHSFDALSSGDEPQAQRPEERGTLPTRQDRPPGLYEPQLPTMPRRRTGNYSLILEGRIIPAVSYQELLLLGLQAIEHMRPGTLDKLSHSKARTKRIVARQRDLLYGNPKLAKHAKQIDGGWWVATNNNQHEVEKFIRQAAFHAGLDVEIRR